jgi:predicted lipid-binding transport protein (Tim44 family)
LIQDPVIRAKIEEANKLNTINKKSVDTNAVYEKQSEDTLNKNMNINKAVEDNIITEEELNAMTNNEEITAKAKDIETKQNRYNKIKAEYDNIEQEVEDRLA